MGVLRPIGHGERLSIVDHLDELRTRLIWCIAVFVVAFSFCYWQNGAILDIVNEPLKQAQHAGSSSDPIQQTTRYERAVGASLGTLAPALRETRAALAGLAAQPGVGEAARREAVAAARRLDAAAAAAARAARAVPEATGRRPVTLGVAEPFVATFTVAGYAALLLSFPFILWQAYAFVLPAFDERERRVALPLMALVPILFFGGVLFGYEVALPRAVSFLQNFNSDSFDILIQARDYYRFVVLFLGLMGLVFQVPVGVLVLTRAGVVNARILWRNQGYVILAISVVAAVVTPTPDPVTMLVTMLPLVLLYEVSIGLSWIFRPKGGTIAARWGEWWDDEDGDDRPGAEDAAAPLS